MLTEFEFTSKIEFALFSSSAEVCLDHALNVLARAIERNKASSQLWQHYLAVYTQHKNSSDLTDLCQTALQYAPSYQIWWQVSSLFYLSYRVQLLKSGRNISLCIHQNFYTFGLYGYKARLVWETWKWSILWNDGETWLKHSQESLWLLEYLHCNAHIKNILIAIDH